MKFSTPLSTIFLSFALLLGCNNSDSANSSSQDDVEENVAIEYTNAQLTYYGDEGYTGESCEFLLSLYTDMEIDQMGNPIGPGHLLALDFNATLFDESATEFPIPTGTYVASPNSYTFSPFTFNYGYEQQLDLTTGIVTVARGSYYGSPAEGSTEYDADLLNEGLFKVSRDEQGIYTIEGCVVGDQFRKRNFIFVGELTASDRSEPTPEPNTTLTQDITLNNLCKARLQDLGDTFFLQDNSYRTFELHLASAETDFSQRWCTTGDYLQIALFVGWDCDVQDGIPAGEYTLAAETDGGGLERSDIRPFNIRPGVADQFTRPSGTWYMSYSDNLVSEYARITGGRMVVERDGVGHDITIEFTDCGTTPHSITCRFSIDEPIELFTY